ncbi:hypothetical protein BGX26_006975 [Mortierella sp. AD094]|nr:hypothetical protein BGX26_006975 [Mortierella sp. AD094]
MTELQLHNRTVNTNPETGDFHATKATKRNRLSYIQDLPTVGDTLEEGVCDQSFVNSWFYWMEAPYALTDRLSVVDNKSKDHRVQHLAYLVCYLNTYETRQIMYKLDFDDAPDGCTVPAVYNLDNHPKRRIEFQQPQSHNITKRFEDCPESPLCFLQTIEPGMCCTLALFNFVVNHDTGSQGSSMKDILNYANKHTGDYDRLSAQGVETLRKLHHWILRDKSDNVHHNVTQNDIEGDLAEGLQPSGNYVIMIMPHKGFVWELDSMDWSSPKRLGKIDDDWTDAAQARLEDWTQAAIKTRVCNDIHAIIAE